MKMKTMFIRIFLFLFVPLAINGCVETDTGFLEKTTKQTGPVVEESVVVPKRFEKVTASRLNFREGASSKARILVVLKRNDSVEILTEKKGWAEVRTEAGQQGWVASSYLTGFEGDAAQRKKVTATAKAEPILSQQYQEVAPSPVEKPTSVQNIKPVDPAKEAESPAGQGELNILGIIPGMEFEEACEIAEQLYVKHKPFFDKGDEGFYDRRVFQEAEDPYGYYDAWCGIFRQTSDKVEIDESGGMLLKKQYGKLVYMAIGPDVVDEFFNSSDMDSAALLKVLENEYNIAPWEKVDMINSQTKEVAYSIDKFTIGATGKHLSITLGPQKFLEVDDFRVEAAAKKTAPRVLNVQYTTPDDPLEKELVDISNDFRKALEEGDLEAFDKHNPTGEKTSAEDFTQIQDVLLALLPDFTNAKGLKFEHDEKDALLVYKTNLENEKMITLASMRFTHFDSGWKISGGMYSTSFEAVNENEDEKAIAKALAEELEFHFQIPEVAEKQETQTEEIDVEVKTGTYGSLIENDVEMEIKSVIPLWDPTRKELTFTLWPFDPTQEEIEYIQWGISSMFWKTDRQDPEPGQWPGGWPYGKYTVSWSMNEDSIGDHSKAWVHVYTYGISKQNNNINLNSNQYSGVLKGIVKEGNEIELIAKGEDDVTDTVLVWSIKFKGAILPALSKETMPLSGNYAVIEELGARYTGDWQDGKKHGQGIYTDRKGDQYSGDWRDDKKHGQGTFTWSDGRKYTGEWLEDNFNGMGMFVEANGDKYDGQWKDGRPHGQLTYTSPSGRKYEGEWQDGMQHGSGTYIDSSGRRYVGTWKNGAKDGQFEFTDSTGTVHKQTFENDKMVEQETSVEVAHTGEKELVTQFPLNLFEIASGTSSVIDVLPPKESLEILQTKNGWVNVKRRSGQQGWVYLPTAKEMDRYSAFIKFGDTDAVKEYLDKGFPMYQMLGDGSVAPLLHIAISLNRYDIADLFIDKGVDVNARDRLDNTTLHYVAISCGNNTPAIAEKLIAAGADVNAKVSYKNSQWISTPLSNIKAALEGKEEGSTVWKNCMAIREVLLNAGAEEGNTSN